MKTGTKFFIASTLLVALFASSNQQVFAGGGAQQAQQEQLLLIQIQNAANEAERARLFNELNQLRRTSSSSGPIT